MNLIISLSECDLPFTSYSSKVVHPTLVEPLGPWATNKDVNFESMTRDRLIRLNRSLSSVEWMWTETSPNAPSVASCLHLRVPGLRLLGQRLLTREQLQEHEREFSSHSFTRAFDDMLSIEYMSTLNTNTISTKNNTKIQARKRRFVC